MVEEKKGPIRKKQLGRFQVSIWKRRRVIPAPDDFGVEREVDIVRACVQYSRYKRSVGTYERQAIWCSPEELRDLAQVLDEIDRGTEGGEDE